MKGNVSRKEPGTPIVRLALIAACTVISLGLMTPSDAADMGSYGGNGGAPFRSECINRSNLGSGAVIVPGDVVIGFNMRSGTGLDAIVPICIRVDQQGREWVGEAYEPTPYVGGAGGGYHKIDCLPGYAVRHFHVYAGPWGDIAIVKHVRMTCERLGGGHAYNVVPDHFTVGSVTGDQRFSCPPNYWGSGIYGRSGNMVDDLGFVCDLIPPL